MDVSSRVADVLDMKAMGTARVKVEYVGPAPMAGSDDSFMLASLRTDGSPANLNGYQSPVLVAQAETLDDLLVLLGRPRRTASRARTGRSGEPSAVGTGARTRPEPVRVAAVAEPQRRAERLKPPRSRSGSRTAPFRCRRRARSTSAPTAAVSSSPPSRLRQASVSSCRPTGPIFRRVRKRRSTSPLSFRQSGRRPAPSGD